jgi:fructokinase
MSERSSPGVVCLGEILIDLFPAELGMRLAQVSAFLPKPGGAPANVAVGVRKLGVSSAFIGKVGADAFGDYLKAVLEEQDVATGGMRVDEQARTTLAFIAMPDVYSAEFVFYRNPGADLMLRADEIDESLLRGCRAFHFGSLSLVDEPAYSATLHAVELARDAGALVSFDVNFRPTLWRDVPRMLERVRHCLAKVDLVKVNEAELELLTGSNLLLPDIYTEATPSQAWYSLLALGPTLAAITLGERGSFFATRQVHGFVSAFPVETIDAIGCGDAFAAGMLSRLAQFEDWREALAPDRLRSVFRFASAAGALTATRRGVIPALPTLAEVEQFLLAQT